MNDCPYCGSDLVTVLKEPTGEPSRPTRPVTKVCLACGRILAGGEMEEGPRIPTPAQLLRSPHLPEPVLVIEAEASAKGEHKQATLRIPYRDAAYWLAQRDYPFSRFHTLSIKGKSLELEGELFEINEEQPLEIRKVFAAYDAARYPWREDVVIRVRVEYIL